MVPDELARSGDEHLAEYVLGYDRKAGTDLTGEVALLRDLGLNETHILVDLGAGTGTGGIPYLSARITVPCPA